MDFALAVCVGCPGGWTCCGTVWGTCVCTHPTWNSCCYSVSDPVCEAANAACIALKETVKTALSGAKLLVDQSRHALEVAQAALVALQQAAAAAQTAVDGAQATLDGLNAAFSVALDAANAIANLGLNGLISIREISFTANLDVAAGGAFSGSVRAVFAGAAEVTISLNINLYDITSMAKELAGHIGSGFSSLF